VGTGRTIPGVSIRLSIGVGPTSLCRRVATGQPWKDQADFARARNETLAAAQHLGWRLWKKWTGYHRRSLVETTMGRFKLLGDRLAARLPERQMAEVHVRCAILNTFNRLGMPVTAPHA